MIELHADPAGSSSSVIQTAAPFTSPAAPRCSTSGWPRWWRAASRWSGCSRPSQPLLLATVRLAGPGAGQADERELHAVITHRHINRCPFSARPVPPGVLAELTEAARLEGAVLHVPGRQEAARLLRLAREAERDLLAQPGYRAELARWAGGDRDRRRHPRHGAGSARPGGRCSGARLRTGPARAGALCLVRGPAAAGRAVHDVR